MCAWKNNFERYLVLRMHFEGLESIPDRLRVFFQLLSLFVGSEVSAGSVLSIFMVNVFLCNLNEQ